MKVAEFIGPSGGGKSAIYNHMLEHGGFIPNPQIPALDAGAIIEKVRGQDPGLDDFISLLDYIERLSGETPTDRMAARVCALKRALSKLIVAASHPGHPQWLVIDGGLINRGQSVDRMVPRDVLRRYFELMPLPHVAFSVECSRENLASRNQERGGSHDRTNDIERSLECHAIACEIVKQRGIPIIPVDSNTLKPSDAARGVLTRLGIQRKYEDAQAASYNADRVNRNKWEKEQRVIENMLSDLPSGSIILDAPVGTGRFLPFYRTRGFIVRGLDLSADMLAEATKATPDPTLQIDGRAWIQFYQGDVCATKLPDQSVDVAVNCRITRWLSSDQCVAMIKEMQRVARNRIILTARVANHPHMRPLELFEAALDPSWQLVRNEAGQSNTHQGPNGEPLEDPDYRILMFQRAA